MLTGKQLQLMVSHAVLSMVLKSAADYSHETLEGISLRTFITCNDKLGQVHVVAT